MADQTPSDETSKPRFAADLGGMDYDQNKAVAMSGLDPKATALDERRKREDERIAHTRVSQELERQMRSTGQKFHSDEYGRVTPDQDEKGGPVFHEKDQVDYTPEGRPVRTQVDKSGAFTESNPDEGAPMGGADSDPGTVYKQNKYQPWTPVGNAYDLKGNPNLDPATKDAVLKVAEHGDDAMRKAANEGVSDMEAKASLKVATSKAEGEDLSKQITDQNAQLDQQTERASKTEGGSWFFNMGAKPTSDAAVAKTQADKTQSNLDALEKQRAEAAQRQMTAEAEDKGVKTDAAILKATTQLQGYEAAETKRREMLMKSGKSQEEVDSDPMLSALAQKKQEVGLDKSIHEQQRMVMQTAGEAATRAFKDDPASREDLAGIDKSFSEKKGVFDDLQRQYTAEGERLKQGIYTSSDEMQASKDRMEDLSKQMNIAGANANALLHVRNAAVQSVNSPSQATPKQGIRSIGVSVGPDMQLSFNDSRDLTQPSATPPPSGASQPGSPAGAMPQGQAGSISQKRNDLKSGIMPYQRQIMDERKAIMGKKMEAPEDWGNKTTEEKKSLVEQFQNQKDKELADYDTKKSEAGGEQADFVKGLQGAKPQSLGEALKDEFAGRIRAAVVAPYAGVQDVSLGFVETLATAYAAATGQKFQDTTLSQFAKGAREQTNEAIGDKADSITAQIMRGAGSSVAFMAAGASMPAIATVGALSAFGGGYREALDMGATGAKAYARAAVAAGLGATEAIPIAHMFERLEKVVPGSVKKFLINTGAQFIEEGGQEFAQDALQGTYDKLTGLSKDDWSKIYGDAASSGAIAGFTGLLFAGSMNAANIRSQRKAAEGYSTEITRAVTSYDQSGGTNARVEELGNQWRSLPTIEPAQGTSRPDQYTSDQKTAEAVTGQLPEGSPAVRPEQVAFARQIAPVSAEKEIAGMQTELSALDAKVTEAQAKAKEAGVDGGFLVGTDHEAHGLALEELGAAVNARADFLGKIQDKTAEASQRSMLSVQAAQEILAMPNAENRSMATGLVKIASGLDQNLLTGAEREMLLKPRKITTPDPITGEPVKQTLPPLIRMEKGQPVITDEAISWMGNNAPISENLISLDETTRLKQIHTKEESQQNAEQPQTGTPNGSPSTGRFTGEGEQLVGNAPSSDQGEQGGTGQGIVSQVGTDGVDQGNSEGGAAPFSPSGDSQSEQRRKLNATRLNPAIPSVIVREAKGIASSFQRAGQEVGLDVEEVPKDQAGPSGAFVTFEDDGRIIFKHNPVVMGRNASSSNGENGKTTEGNASEYLHSMFGEEGLHFGWFSHLRDQWNAKPEEDKGTFSSFVHTETKTRFEDMRSNLASISATPSGIELSKAVIGAYNNYFGEESKEPVGDGDNEASGNAVGILDRLSNQTDPSHPENAFSFMNEFARQLAQMRVEGRVTESADANGFFESVMKYLRGALDSLRKVAGNTKTYDAGLDEMVSSMETRYADIQALMGVKPAENAIRTQESTDNNQKQPESTQSPATKDETTEMVRLRQENNKFKAEQDQRQATQDRAKARQGNAKEQAEQIDTSTMEGVNSGRAAVVTASNNEQIPARYVTLPAGAVQTSHSPVASGDGSPSALFPKNQNYGGENTRPYENDITEQSKVNSIATPGALLPDEIINNSPSAAGGPPQIARVTFLDKNGKPKTVFQTAGGNGREMGINLSSQEDQGRLSESLRQNAGVFGLQDVPEGHRVYRYLGDYDLRNPEEAKSYQQLVDKLNPSQGKIQGTTQRAKIDANIKIPQETLATLTMDTNPSDSQQIVRQLINNKSLGLDRNLMEATASDPVQSQQYVQQLVISAGLKSDSLNEAYFDLRGDTTSNPARSTMRALIGGTAELGVKLRQKNASELADALAATLERINAELEKPKNPLTIKQALALVASQQEIDTLTTGTGGNNSAGQDVQEIAKALLSNVKLGSTTTKAGVVKSNGKLSASATQENFAALLRDINLAVDQQTNEGDIFGESRSVSDMIRAAIDNNNRRRGIDGNSTNARSTKDRISPGHEELKSAISAIHLEALKQSPKFLRDLRTASRASGVEFQSQFGKNSVKKLTTALSKIGRKFAVPSDILRGTVVSTERTPEGVAKDAMAFVQAMFNAGYKLYAPNGAIDFTDRHLMPDWEYKDIAMKFVRDGDNVVKEVLMLQPKMLIAKHDAHPIYEHIREIDRRLEDDVNPMKPDQVAMIQKVRARKEAHMKQIYRLAYKKDNNQRGDSRYSLDSSISSEDKYKSGSGVEVSPAKSLNSESDKPSGMLETGTPSSLAAFSTKDFRSSTDRGLSLIRGKSTAEDSGSQDQAAARRSRFQDDSTSDLFSVGNTEDTTPELTEPTNETKLKTEAKNDERPNTRRAETDARRPEAAGTEEPTQSGAMGELFSFMDGQRTAERDFESTKSEAGSPSDAGRQNDSVASLEGSDGRGGSNEATLPVSDQLGGDGGRGDAGRPARKGRTISQAGTGVAVERPEEGSAERNISLNRDQRLAPKGVTGKLKANLAAIRIIKALDSEGRLATPEEKQELVKFSGWGALSQSFDDAKAEQVANGKIEEFRAEATQYEGYGANAYYEATVERNRKQAQSLENWKNQWGEAHNEIKSLLSESEYNTAKRSTINAHYTSAEIVAGMWDAVKELGFEGGNVLEPGAGIGHFFGLMPSEIADKSKLFGVELDKYTSKILKALYPEADIQNAGFQTADIADNSIDLAISNVPFANVAVNDPALEAMGGPVSNLHDYFFGKTLTKLKPGGVMAFITSAFTMDKGNPEIRKWLAERADLVAAYRLPNDAFKDNAGTDVVTDVIILRKKDGKPFPHAQSWTNLGDTKTQKGEPIRINEYFANNPSNVFGLLDDDGSMYGNEKEMTVHGDSNNPPSLAMMRQLASLPKGIMGKVEETGPVRTGATGTLKFGNVIKKDGEYFFQGQEAADEALNAPENAQRVDGFITLRDALNRQYDLELSETATDREIEENRTALNAAYERFVAIRVTKKTKTGKTTNSALGVSTYVHDTFNKSLFAGDPDIFRLLGAELEVETKATSLQNITDIVKGKTKKAYKKADVFSKRVLEPRSEPTKADTIEDAYGISLGWRNRIDSQFIAGLIGKTPDQVDKGLLERGIAFRDPSTGQLYSREQYISGNVRKKLQIAKASGPEYQRNVALLEGIQPQRVGISDIKFKVGATWIPSEVYTGFLESLGVQGFKFIYKTAAGSSDWAMVKDKRTWKSGVAYKDFETNEVGIEHVMDSLLNFNPIVINNPKKDGGKRNETATQAAREKAKLLTERFVKWANENEEIANQLTDIYNEEVNAHVQRTYDGQFLSLPWANKDFGIYPDKKNTIWRAIQEGFGLIAHGVGGGKTVIGTAIALEMRRLGMAKKPMIVVHNATLEGFAKEIAKMAPSSRILIGRKDELAGPKRKEFLMRIAAGDWDAVVIAHSTFSTISDDPDVEIAQSKSLIDEALATLKEAGYDSVFDAKSDKKKPPTVKALVKLIEKLETSIDKAKDRKKADKDLLNFQQLGVDSLIVDEVHEFKKIPFTTHLSAKGIDGSMSKRAYALFMRARQIQAKTGGKNIFSMTGTPVTNTLGEIWNMIRLVAPNVLKEYKVELFDQFHSKFAEVVTQSEMGPNGEYKNVERLAKFVNLPEWNTFLRQAADIKLGDDMVVKNRPDIKGGAPELIVVKRTKGATEWVRYIREVLKAYEKISGKEKQKNPKLMAVPVQSYMASRAAAIDIRLIDPTAKDEPGSKVNTMIEKLMGIYEQTAEYSGTQAIFADSYRSVKTSIFDDVMGNNLEIEKDPNKIEKNNAVEGINENEEEEEDEEVDEDPSKAFTDERFNIYEDIREKLIGRGVPADQIAVITDKKYKTDKDKQALFDRVNSGEVRIIMGSTQKLGTGVNMQRLMIAAHHLDVPWTPAGLEQRDGRVYRQGNIHGEIGVPIELYRYGMEDTLDSSLWQKLVTKQRTSYAALSGKVTGRELEEDDVSLNLSEQQAILGGKTSLRIWEIENRLKELGISKQANGDESYRRSTEIRNAKTYLNVMGNRSDRIAPSLAKMEGVAASVTEKGVNIEVGGETFKTKTETAEAIKAAFEESRNRLVLTDNGNQTAPDVTSISVNGTAIRLTPFVTSDKVYDEEAQSMVEKTIINYELISRPEDREDDISFGKVSSPATLLSRLEELGETIEGIKASQRNNLENLRQVAEMSEVAAWPYAEEYDSLVKELEEMRKAYREELGLKEEAKAAEGAEVNETADSSESTEGEQAPVSEGDQLKNKLIAAARKINSFEEEQRTAGNPDYQAALDAAREARDELADYNIGKREGDADYVSAVAARAPRMATLTPEEKQIMSDSDPLAFNDEEGSIGTVMAIRIAKKLVSSEDFKKKVKEKEFENEGMSDGLDKAFSIEMAAREILWESQGSNPESNNITSARSPYFGGLDSRAATAVENAFDSLDSDSMMEQQAKAEDQKPGQRTIGSPRLALGGLNTQIMGVDAYRERIATTETQKQWREEASAMLKKDYEGTRKRLIQAGMLGGSLTPAETKAAMMIVAKETTAAATDPTKRAEVAKLIYAYRETGKEEARSLSARRDMFMTRQERHREFLAKMIFSPSKADQAVIEQIESPAERETAIAAAVERRMSEIEKALKAMGVSFDDILKGEVEVSLIGSRVVENTLKAFSDKEQQALRMFQVTKNYQTVAKTFGFSVSQVKAMRLKAIASIKNRHFDKVRKGLTVDDLKKDMNAVFARSPRQISEAAAEVEFAKIIEALGFGENAGAGRQAGGKKPFVLEDPIEVIKIARLIAATDKGAMDMVHEYWMASLLSGITTHAANIAGNTANAALDLTFQRGMETLVNAMVGDKDSARAGEFKYLMSGLKGSMSAAFRAGIRAYDAEQSMVDYDLLGHELSISPSGFIPGANMGAAIKGKLGRAIRIPLRALTFMDDFSKTMVARMEVGAQAYRIGIAQGYKEQQLSDFIASEVETIGSQSWERAVGRSTILAFQQKLRSIEEGGNLIEGGAVALNKGLQHYKPGKFFVPFINTVYNIFRTGVRKTPVGSGAMLYKAARQGFYSIQNGKLNPHPYATSEFVRDSAEQVMAWALLAMMWGVVPGDDDDDKKGILITGSQPFQKGMTGLQDLSQRTGVPPYHIRVGDTLFNYGRIEPIATVLGTTADLVKAGKMARDKREGSEIVGYLASRILGQITDKTYGRGMSDIAGFIQDPKSMANWAATFAATFVPNILRQPMRAFDPYVRETSIETSPENLPAGVAQRFMQAAVPMAGVNKPRVDLYGNPIKKEGSVASRLLSPAQAAPVPKVQPADKLFSNWNKNNPSDAYAPARASRRYVNPVTGEVKYMDDKTFQRFNEAAGKTFAATSRAVITPSMAKNPTEDDKDRVKKLLSQARKDAKREVLMTNPKERSLKEILFGSN